MYCNHFKNPLTCLQCTHEDREQARIIAQQIIDTRPAISRIQEIEVESTAVHEIEPEVIVEEPEEISLESQDEPVKFEILAPLPSLDKKPTMSENTITVSLKTVSGESIKFDCPVCEDTQELVSSIARNVSSKNPSIKSMDISNPRKISI